MACKLIMLVIVGVPAAKSGVLHEASRDGFFHDVKIMVEKNNVNVNEKALRAPPAN